MDRREILGRYRCRSCSRDNRLGEVMLWRNNMVNIVSLGALFVALWICNGNELLWKIFAVTFIASSLANYYLIQHLDRTSRKNK